MKIEQLQYFSEAVHSGSISAAAKKLFISQQGLSEALHRLEEELGFTLLKREKRGVSLTENGKIFYTKTQKFLSSYTELRNCAAMLHNQLQSNNKIIFAVVPLLSNLIIQEIYKRNLAENFSLHEAGIKETLDGLTTQTVHLGLVLIGCNEEISFLKSLPSEVDAIELFSDEWVACISANSKFKDLEEIDSSDNSISFVEYSTTYYKYFDMNIEVNSTIKSNNAALHLKMMRDNNMVSVTMKKIANKMYPQDDIILKPFKERVFCKAFLLKNKLFGDKYLEKSLNEIKNIIKDITS